MNIIYISCRWPVKDDRLGNRAWLAPLFLFPVLPKLLSNAGHPESKMFRMRTFGNDIASISRDIMQHERRRVVTWGNTTCRVREFDVIRISPGCEFAGHMKVSRL